MMGIYEIPVEHSCLPPGWKPVRVGIPSPDEYYLAYKGSQPYRCCVNMSTVRLIVEREDDNA